MIPKLQKISVQSIVLPVLLGLSFHSPAQPLNGPELLSKSIDYHDPNDQWSRFKGTLDLTETRPGGPDRKTNLRFNNRTDCFRMEQFRGKDLIVRTIKHGKCSHALNGNRKFTPEQQETHRLNCERTRLLRDYYTYLWGLPMKLRDKGTIVHDEVVSATFQGGEYLRLKVTYEASVGGDTWYFYFDPASYALCGYRFYHDESKNDGEYIVLEGEVELVKMRLPKHRKWYINKDDKFLGADILNLP